MTQTGQIFWKRQLTALGVAAVGLVLIFASDARDLVSIWLNASTYNHGALIPFLAAWLVWQRKDELAHFVPEFWWPGLLGIGGGAALWLLGDAGSIALFRQAALVVMLQSLVPTLLGAAITRALAFPLFYLFFMVPVGEELVPALQILTAKMSMALLSVAGIPAHIEGIFITTPNGYYKVAEACAGVKFLVAMVAYGALVANVCFRSWPRRIGFMAASIVVPILANGVRAFATIYVGYKTTADAASGFDHVLYGWFFFALVMALVMAVGWPFFDRKPGDPWISFAPKNGPATRETPWRGLIAIAMIALAPLGWSALSATWGRVPMRAPVALPIVAGWQPVSATGLTPWRPRYEGADRFVAGTYRGPRGEIVDMVVVLYAGQDEGREMVGYGQGAAGLDDDAWVWSSDGPMIHNARSEILTAPGAVQRLAATWYLAGGKLTGSGAVVKLETLKTRLLARDQVAAAVIISAQDREGHPAERAVRSFGAALGSPRAIAEAAIAQARR